MWSRKRLSFEYSATRWRVDLVPYTTRTFTSPAGRTGHMEGEPDRVWARLLSEVLGETWVRFEYAALLHEVDHIQ